LRPYPVVLVRGGGDLGSGAAIRLVRAGFRVAVLECAAPTLIRHTVAFGTAVFVGRFAVEGLTACRVDSSAAAEAAMEAGDVPVLVDPEAAARRSQRPAALVDAILSKGAPATRIADAPVVVGLGPGFEAGVDAHAVVETLRGHHLGRALYAGRAAADTGLPGELGGASAGRVIRAPADGPFEPARRIGDRVSAGDVVGAVAGRPATASIAGVLRGLLWSGVPATRGMKVGDVDPRGDASVVREVSDKALAVGGGVLEAVLHFREKWDRTDT
jgi:xanthine dehydrogenase accessory factor